MLGEWARRCGFWLADGLGGGQVRRHYFDIQKMMETGGENTEALNSLLHHACHTSEFYSAYQDTPLEDFPVIDKNVIRSSYETILSADYEGEKLHKRSTSGSTGTPFTIRWDKGKRSRQLAETIYFGRQCGYNIGDRYAYIRTWTDRNKKGSLQAFSQNLIMMDTSVLSNKSLDLMKSTLKADTRIKCLFGYASSLDVLSRYLLEQREGPESFGLKVVVSGAEVLSEATRANLKRVFDCNVVSRYANMENGIIAQEVIDNVFVVNRASYRVEFLKINSDEPAVPGELSRVILTDLYNYAMPMIRYDTGDLAIFEHHPKYGKVITSIEGRVRDFIYDTKGNLLSPSAITVRMWQFDNIEQFQFVQETEKRYVLKLNVVADFYDEDKLVTLIKEVVGHDAEVLLEYVDGIPRLRSGKSRQVVCNYKPSI